MNIDIKISDSALAHLKQKMSEENVIFRLSIKKTGCSGYSYFPTIEKKLNHDDVEVIIDPQLTIYLDTKWVHLLKELTIDYVEDEKSQLKQKRLDIRNPKEMSRCGCGESFNLESPDE